MLKMGRLCRFTAHLVFIIVSSKENIPFGGMCLCSFFSTFSALFRSFLKFLMRNANFPSFMQTFTFGIRFRFDSAKYYETSFDLSLSDEEIAFVKSYLKENGDIPFWAFEFENEALFNRFMTAHTNAILDYVNKNVIEPGEEPFTEETVCWEDVWPEFDWPKHLLES